MATIQDKCAELIKLAADISVMNFASHSASKSGINGDDIKDIIDNKSVNSNSSKINVSINPVDNARSTYYKKIPIRLDGKYDIGELFIKVMGDEDNKGVFKWYSIIEKENNHFNLKGEIKSPLNIIDISWKSNGLFIFTLKYEDIIWTGERPLELADSDIDLEMDPDDYLHMSNRSSSDSDYKEGDEDEGDEDEDDEGEEDEDGDGDGDGEEDGDGDEDDDDDDDDEDEDEGDEDDYYRRNTDKNGEDSEEEDDELKDIVIKREGIHVSIA